MIENFIEYMWYLLTTPPEEAERKHCISGTSFAGCSARGLRKQRKTYSGKGWREGLLHASHEMHPGTWS